MRIQFDYQAFSMQRFGGISRYFAALSSHLSKQQDSDFNLRLLHSENGYLNRSDQLLPYSLGHFFLNKKSRMERWNRRYFQFVLKRNDFDIFHPTYYDPYFLSYVKKPYVITVHDMIHELFPEYFYPNDVTSYNKRKVIESASHVIAISESTKRDLQHFYDLPDAKVSVIYHGLFSEISTIKNKGSSFLPKDSYILYVGDRETYKNFYRFTRALSLVMARHQDIKLVCAGGGCLTSKEKEHLSGLKIIDRVVQLSVNDIELNALYQNALFFCYPSLYEGFGLPILEAFANRCPVAVSNTSCFKEVGGDAVVYFNPYDLEEMESTFLNIIDDSMTRLQLGEDGFSRLDRFSGKKCVEETVKVYEHIKG